MPTPRRREDSQRLCTIAQTGVIDAVVPLVVGREAATVMTASTVTELDIALEAVTRDPFIDGLGDYRSTGSSARTAGPSTTSRPPTAATRSESPGGG